MKICTQPNGPVDLLLEGHFVVVLRKKNGRRNNGNTLGLQLSNKRGNIDVLHLREEGLFGFNPNPN